MVQGVSGQGDTVDVLAIGLGGGRELGIDDIVADAGESGKTVDDIDSSVGILVKGDDTFSVGTA